MIFILQCSQITDK